MYNGNFDNAEHDYICRANGMQWQRAVSDVTLPKQAGHNKVGDKIVNPDGHAYEILERLGHGTFGQVHVEFKGM